MKNLFISLFHFIISDEPMVIVMRKYKAGNCRSIFSALTRECQYQPVCLRVDLALF